MKRKQSSDMHLLCSVSKPWTSQQSSAGIIDYTRRTCIIKITAWTRTPDSAFMFDRFARDLWYNDFHLHAARLTSNLLPALTFLSWPSPCSLKRKNPSIPRKLKRPRSCLKMPCRRLFHIIYSFWYSSLPSSFFDSATLRTALLKSSWLIASR